MTVASKVKQTLASIKSIQSTLRIYSIQSQDREAKEAFKQGIKITDSIIDDLQERIKSIELEEPQYKGF